MKKLRLAIIIVIGIFTISSVLAIFFVSYNALTKESISLFSEYQLALTQEAGKRFTDWIEKLYGEVYWLSRFLSDTSEEAWLPLMQDTWERIRSGNKRTIREIWVLDKEGKGKFILPVEARNFFIGRSFSYRNYFKKAKETLQPELTLPFLGEDGRYRIALVVPFKKEGKFNGIIGLSLSPETLYRDQFHFLRLGQGSQMALSDKAGNVLLSPMYIGEKIFLLKEKERLYPLNSRVIRGKVLFGNRVFSPHSIISDVSLNLFGSSYNLIAFTPQQEALLFPMNVLRLPLVFTFVAIGFIILGFYSFWERMKMSDKLYKLSVTDGLTKLRNHHNFYTVLPREIKRAKRYNRPLTLIMADVDGFKKYNDTYGHLEGDKVLEKTGAILQESLREGIDAAFRYGGDEFAILLPETSVEEAKKIADRIKEKFADEGLSLSMGVVEWEKGWDEKTLVREADRALYKVKKAK
ncbi:MAG: diguanylate cyclase [Caldiserica bacterium]|nr:diguanylate cyclase [Caldisericota bacterium]